MDQLSRLFVNGCSFLNHRHTNEIDIDFSPAELIKEHGQFETMTNFARGGRGNDRAYLTTVQYFEREPKRKRDTFVMIGWSASSRLDYPTLRQFKAMPPQGTCWATSQMLTKMDVFDELAKVKKQPINYPDWITVRYFQNVLGLQNYLKMNNIPYVFYNSLQHDLHGAREDHKFWLKAIDKTRFYDVLNSQYSYCMKNKLFISTNDEHPNEQGHKTWANKVSAFIEKNKLYGN